MPFRPSVSTLRNCVLCYIPPLPSFKKKKHNINLIPIRSHQYFIQKKDSFSWNKQISNFPHDIPITFPSSPGPSPAAGPVARCSTARSGGCSCAPPRRWCGKFGRWEKMGRDWMVIEWEIFGKYKWLMSYIYIYICIYIYIQLDIRCLGWGTLMAPYRKNVTYQHTCDLMVIEWWSNGDLLVV